MQPKNWWFVNVSPFRAAAQIRPEWFEAYKVAHAVSTLDDFVYMVTASEWEKSLGELVEGVASLRGNRIALARFKSAFECGREALKQAARPSSKSQDEDEILPEGTMQQLNRDWHKRYNLQFEPWFEPSEQLRSRVYREWRKESMSVIDAKKIKSMMHITTPKAKERVELPGSMLVFGGVGFFSIAKLRFFSCFQGSSKRWYRLGWLRLVVPWAAMCEMLSFKRQPVVSHVIYPVTRWWFQTFFIFTPTWGNDPIWLIFFKWVETTT